MVLNNVTLSTNYLFRITTEKGVTMKVIVTFRKKGLGNVVLTQGFYTDGTEYYTMETNGITVSLKSLGSLKATYLQYKKSQWEETVEKVDETVEKVAAPKPTREERLTEKYGDKDARRAFKDAEKRLHRYYMVKVDSKKYSNHQEYLKAVNAYTKKALEAWEAQGRPALAC